MSNVISIFVVFNFYPFFCEVAVMVEEGSVLTPFFLPTKRFDY